MALERGNICLYLYHNVSVTNEKYEGIGYVLNHFQKSGERRSFIPYHTFNQLSSSSSPSSKETKQT